MKSIGYEQYKKLLLKLHEMNVQGTDQTPEADLIRNEMDAPWYSMSEQEREQLGNLSGDLYMLTGEEVKVKAEHPISLEEIEEIFCSEKWDLILELLRRNDVPLRDEELAPIRAVCWVELGEYDVALLFIRHAVRLDSGNLTYQGLTAVLEKDIKVRSSSASVRCDVTLALEQFRDFFHTLNFRQTA